jgi:hypothetical protein
MNPYKTYGSKDIVFTWKSIRKINNNKKIEIFVTMQISSSLQGYFNLTKKEEL